MRVPPRLLAAALVLTWSPWLLADELAVVTRVVDGDTIVVAIDAREEKVRLIGVDTPETVHPRKPVERFATEASAFTKELAEGKTVRLQPDPQCTDRDKYGRLLRYVWLDDKTLLNGEIISHGYGFAYVKYPFSMMEEFQGLEREARGAERGLWAER
jgi:micrococcal nuclease